MASTSSAPYSEDTERLMDVSETIIPPSEDDFENTVELLQIMDVEELNGEVAISLEEVEGSSQFACQYCPKLCKSKGGLTKHIRSKHVGEGSISNEYAKKIQLRLLTLENMLSIIRDIGKYLSDESIYKKEHIAEIFGLIPSASFVSAMNDILKKFYGNRDQDKMLQRFYGETSKNWKEYFIPCEDQKIVNLMLIHLPERLLTFLEEDKTTEEKVEICISPQEQGPLTYVIGYVLQSLYRKSKNSPRWNSPRNKEIQALVSSMRIPTEENDYIFSLSRGGLWTPNSSVVSIAEVSELSFKMYTNKDRTTRLPVDKIVDEVLTSPLVKSLWCNIVENCDVPISKECQSLCLENIVKLYITVRCFSFAKDIVNKYKLKEKAQQKKALRKQLKLGSE